MYNLPRMTEAFGKYVYAYLLCVFQIYPEILKHSSRLSDIVKVGGITSICC